MASKKKKTDPATQTKRKPGGGFSTSPSTPLRVASRAIIPPGYDDMWDPSKLFVRRNTNLCSLLSGDSTISAVQGFLSPEEAQSWITHGEKHEFELAKHPQGSGIAARDCWRLVIEDMVAAGAIFERLNTVVPPEMQDRSGKWKIDSCATNLRLYRYGEGQLFGKHYDESNSLPGNRRSFFTVLLYLNGGSDDEGLEGGETNFYTDHRAKDPIVSFPPRAGAMLVHEHGDRCLLHEGARVLAGSKYLLRTDVVYKKAP